MPLLLHTAAPLAQQIATQGDCSPVIVGVTGDVRANINCHKTLLAPAPITLHTIETILHKGDTVSGPLFFRPEGTLWIDFVHGFHPFSDADVASIKDRMERTRASFVIGESTKWRESFARFVGWSAVQDGRSAFYTDASRWPAIPVFDLVQLSELKGPAVLIIENAHWRSDQIDDLLLAARTKSAELRVLISASPSFLSDPLQLPGPRTSALSVDALHLDARELAERLVKVYAEKMLRFGPDKQIVNALIDVSDRFSRFDSSSFFDTGPEFDVDPFVRDQGRSRRGPSLWSLAGVLSSWDGKSVPESSLSRGRTDPTSSTLPLFAGLSTEAISCLYAIAMFSSFNTPAPGLLLTDALKYPASVVQSLLQRELIDRNDYGFVIRDTGMMPVVLQRLVRGGELETDLQRRVQERNVQVGLLTRAVEFGVPTYDTMLLNYTAYHFISAHRRAAPLAPGREAPSKLIEAAERALQADERPGNFGRGLIGFGRLPGAVPARLNAKIASMIAVLAEPTTTGKDIAWFLMGLQASDSLSAVRVAEQISTERAVQLLQTEPKFGRVGSILWALQRVNAAKATEILGALDVAQLVKAHESTLEPAALGWVLEVFAGIDKRVAARLADLADIESAGFQRAVAAHPTQLSSFAFGLSSAAPSRAAIVFDRLGSNFFVSTLRATVDDMQFAIVLRALALAKRDLARSVAASFGWDAITQRIRASRSNEAAGLLWVAIREVDAELAARLRMNVRTNLSAEEASAARQVRMFSTMDPTAMAMAENQRRRLSARLRALQVYQTAYETNLELDAVDVSKLVEAYQIHPERVIQIVRATSWDHLIKIYGYATPPSVQFQFARLLYVVTPERFGEWLNAANDSPIGTVFDSRVLDAMMIAGRPPGELAWARSVRKLDAEALKGLQITDMGYDAGELTGFLRFLVAYDQRLAERFARMLTQQPIKVSLPPPKLGSFSGLVVTLRDVLGRGIESVRFLIQNCPEFQVGSLAADLSRTKPIMDCLVQRYGLQADSQLTDTVHIIELFKLLDLAGAVRKSGSREDVQTVVSRLFRENARLCTELLRQVDGATLLRNIDPAEPLSFDDAPEYVGAIHEARGDLREDIQRTVLAWIRTGDTRNWPDRFFLIWRTSWTSRDLGVNLITEMTDSEVTESIIAGRRLADNLSHLITLGRPSADTFLKRVDSERIRSILLDRLFERGGFTLLAEVIERVAPSSPTYIQSILDHIDVWQLQSSLLASFSGTQERRYTAKLIGALAKHAPSMVEKVFDRPFISQALGAQGATPDSVEELFEAIAALHKHHASLWQRVMVEVMSPAVIEYFRAAATRLSDKGLGEYSLATGINGILTQVSLLDPTWLRRHEDAIRRSVGEKIAKRLHALKGEGSDR